jgi:putative transposase
MRYPASEKLEIIRLVEQSHLPMRRTLEKLGISRPTFYRWYAAYQAGGPEALEAANHVLDGCGTGSRTRSGRGS